MKNSITLLLLLCSIICLVPEANGADYYWVGNGGLWSDTNHWASSPSGPGGAYSTPPTASDNVNFTSNSFTLDEQEVVLAIGNNYCYTMKWTGVKNNPVLKFPSAQSRLNVYYQLEFDDNMSVDFLGAENLGYIYMQNDGLDPSVGYTAGVSTRGKQIPNIVFTGENSEWAITDPLNVNGEIKLINGQLRSGSPSDEFFNIITKDFIIDGPTVDLQMERMNIIATDRFSILNVGILRTVSNNGNYISTITTNNFQSASDNATEFGKLIINGTNGVLDGSIHNLEFVSDVIFEASGTNTILGTNTFSGNIYFNKAGSIVLFESGKTQYLSNKSDLISTVTNCGAYIILKSTTEGVEATIDKNGNDDILLNNFYIQDIHIMSNGTFEAELSVNLGNTDGWTITSDRTPGDLTLYWIGGTGEWSDASHWATSTGSTGCIPTVFDNVVFRDDSFDSDGQTVTVDLPAIYFNNMTWTDDVGSPTFSIPSGDVYVGGSIELAPTMSVNTNGTIHFVAESGTQTITAENNSGIGFDLKNIIFDGGATWTLEGNLFTSGSILLKDGTLDTNSPFPSQDEVAAETISVDGSGVHLSLNNSRISTTTFEILSIGTINPGTSHILTQNFNITPDGLSFHHVLLRGNEGILRGSNLNFFDLILSNEVKSSVFGSHSYSNLLQFDKPGMIVEFEAGTTQEMFDLEVSELAGGCGEEIFLRSSISGSPVNFVSTAGAPIEVSFLLIQDNAASPVDAFEATNSQKLGNVNDGWKFDTGSGSVGNFYWIGGDGNWNDGENWSDEPEGSPINCIPTPNDNVFFGANSFTGPNQTVTLNGPEQYCRSMTWDGVTNMPTMYLPAGNSLYIYGSLSLLSSTTAMTMQFGDGDDAVIECRSTAKDNKIRISGHIIPNLTFDGPEGVWDINGAIEVGSTISVLNGLLNTNGINVVADQFIVDGANAALSLGSSTLDIANKFDITQMDPINFDAGTSIITTNILESNIEGISFNQVNLAQNPDSFDASPTLNGNNLIFNTLILQGSANNFVYGSHLFNQALQFHVIGIPRFYFESGSTQTLGSNGMLLRTSDIPEKSAIIDVTGGTDANFSKANGAVCVDFLIITDVNAIGGAKFGLVQGTSSVTSATGWEFTDLSCETFLPVDCIDFAAAVKTDNSVELYWITAQEINNSGFEVQRSTDGRRFETIAWVDGAGTTSEAQKYTYIDQRTEGFTEAYYRIKQIDFDGTAAFACDIQAVNFRHIGDGPLQVFPNPARELIQVRWFGQKTGTTILRLFDQSGRLVIDREWSTLEGNNQRELPVKDLPKGIYELQLVNGNGQMQATRVVKQ